MQFQESARTSGVCQTQATKNSCSNPCPDKAFQSREARGGQGETLVLHIVQLHAYTNTAPCNLPMESLVGCYKKGLCAVLCL